MDVDRLALDLAEYYDQEAPARDTWQRDAEMVHRQTAFAQQISANGCGRLLEIGCGTGRDATRFRAAGVAGVVGLDLSENSVRIARAHGVDAVCGSVHALPFAARSFEACWTVSVLIHVPDERWTQTYAEVNRVLVPGSLMAVGVWGSGSDDDLNGIKESDVIEPKRVFYRRSDEHMRQLLDELGDIVEFATWKYETQVRPYQYAVVQTRR